MCSSDLEKNFGKSTIEGIFTLGQSTTEELAVIDQKKAELENIRIDGVNKSETLAKINADIEEVELSFKDKVWISYFKKYESNFKVAFKGFAQKESFKARLLRQAAPVAQIKIEDLEAKAEIVFVDAQPRVEAPSLLLCRRACWMTLSGGKRLSASKMLILPSS